MLSEKKKPSNYIVILNYNTWKDSIGCIESIINNSFKDYQIVLIDNNSVNNSEQKIIDYFNGVEKPTVSDDIDISINSKELKKLPHIYHKAFKSSLSFLEKTEEFFNSNIYIEKSIIDFPIIFIQTDKNLGFAGGNNIALKSIIEDNNISNNTNIFLLNPDTYLYPHTLFELNKIQEETFICGMKIKNPNGNKWLGAFKINKYFAGLSPINDEANIGLADFIYGGALYTNKQTLINNGLLPEKYFLYWEETDWCYQAKLNGTKFLIQPSALVYDKVGTSIGRGFLAYYYYIRNGLYFYKKYFKVYIPFLLFFSLIRIFIKAFQGNFRAVKGSVRGILDYFKKKVGKLA